MVMLLLTRDKKVTIQSYFNIWFFFFFLKKQKVNLIQVVIIQWLKLLLDYLQFLFSIEKKKLLGYKEID